MRLLHILADLDESDFARQVFSLAPAFSRLGHSVEVCSIRTGDREASPLRDRGVSVQSLGWRRWLDSGALWQFRRLIRHEWDAIHVWGLSALRAVAWVAQSALPRVVVSSPWPERGGLRWWDRRVLQRTRCIVVSGESERQRCMRERLDSVPWHLIPPAAPYAEPAAQAKDEAAPAWQRGPTYIACASPLERGRGYREAIWAADILHHIFPDLHLLIAGSGPRKADLACMIASLEIGNAHLVGDVPWAELLGTAELCWVPSRVDVGRQTALEAMALGRAVIASDVPCLRELIRDGETGCLVPPGEPVALARCTRTLMLDPALRDRLGAAAREHVQAHFSLPQVAARWLGLYDDLRARRAA